MSADDVAALTARAASNFTSSAEMASLKAPALAVALALPVRLKQNELRLRKVLSLATAFFVLAKCQAVKLNQRSVEDSPNRDRLAAAGCTVVVCAPLLGSSFFSCSHTAAVKR